MFYRISLRSVLPVWVILLTCFCVSCKENTIIRTDVVPAVDNINVFGTDTLTLITNTVKDDSVVTNAYVSGLKVYMGAGNISNDAYFGKTSANFYFQVRPPQDNYSFDRSKYQLDSAVLILPYSGTAYGDTVGSAGYQTFKAYRLTESIYFDSIYYAHSPARSVEATPFASKTVFIPDLVNSRRDSTLVGGIKRAPHLRMRITDNDLINTIIGANATNTAAFLTLFKGIFITTEAGGNTIPYFLLNGDDIFSKAGILMYYHTQNSSGIITDTLTASFPFDATASQTKTGFFNRVTRDFTGTPVQYLFSSTAGSEGTIAVQNLPGAAIDLRIPYVKNLPRCIVNKAELIITQVPSPMDGVFAPPDRLYPMVISEYGERSRIADLNATTSSASLYFVDGYSRAANVGGKVVNQYVLNFPRELQNAIVEQKKELRLRINGTQSFIGAFRLTAAGSNYSQPAYRIKLNVVYTKF
ncbi:MAG TPA: DUF4270 family protein [Chitinophagaceae bacterium]|nr:DUF4270 family protein [Chitinophagaceae bacterium]